MVANLLDASAERLCKALAERPARLAHQHDRLPLGNCPGEKRESGRLIAPGIWPAAYSCGSRTSTMALDFEATACAKAS